METYIALFLLITFLFSFIVPFYAIARFYFTFLPIATHMAIYHKLVWYPNTSIKRFTSATIFAGLSILLSIFITPLIIKSENWFHSVYYLIFFIIIQSVNLKIFSLNLPISLMEFIKKPFRKNSGYYKDTNHVTVIENIEYYRLESNEKLNSNASSKLFKSNGDIAAINDSLHQMDGKMNIIINSLDIKKFPLKVKENNFLNIDYCVRNYEVDKNSQSTIDQLKKGQIPSSKLVFTKLHHKKYIHKKTIMRFFIENFEISEFLKEKNTQVDLRKILNEIIEFQYSDDKITINSDKEILSIGDVSAYLDK